MQKFIKNITEDLLIVGGIKVQAGTFLELISINISKFAFRAQVNEAIQNDQILVSLDGENTLSKALSLEVIRHIDFAENISFDNSSNNFDAYDVQDAIEEVANLNFVHYYYSYVEDETVSSTTNLYYQQKLRLTTPNLPAGNYRISWYYEWKYSNGRFKFKHRVQLNDNTILKETQTTPRSNGDWRESSGFKSEISLTEGVHNIDMDYCTNKVNKTAYIRRARLEIWRID